MVKKKIQTLNGLGHGWVFWARSYHYTITEQSRSISHTPAARLAQYKYHTTVSYPDHPCGPVGGQAWEVLS